MTNLELPQAQYTDGYSSFTIRLLSISDTISNDGKKFFLYKSRIKQIQTKYNDGSVDIEIVLNRRH